MKFSQPVMIAGSALLCIISMLLSADRGATGEDSAALTGAQTLVADSSDPEVPPQFSGAASLPPSSTSSQINTSPRDVSSRLINEQIRQRLSGETESFPSSDNRGTSQFEPARPPVGSNPPPYPEDRGRDRQPYRNSGGQFDSSGQYDSAGQFERQDNRWRNDRLPDTSRRAGEQDYYPEDSRGDAGGSRGNDPFLPPDPQRNGSNISRDQGYDGTQPNDTPVTPPVSAYETPKLNLDGSTSGGDLDQGPINPGIMPSQIITTDTLPSPSLRSFPSLPVPIITHPRNPLGLFSTQGDLFRAEPLLSGGVPIAHPGGCSCTTCKTTCQPLCLTKTIMVPEWYTVYSTVNETHYRPRIKEQPYFVEQKITHQVPVIETFPVIVKEPRVRNIKTYRKEEYQVPREVEYTVMVPKPKTRQVTSERKESYEVPEEEQFTVMVPKEKEVRKTKYKMVKEKEPVYKEEVVMVPQTRTRVKIDYETHKRTFVRKVPFTKTIERQLVRLKVKYRSEVKQVRVNEEYYEYENVAATCEN